MPISCIICKQKRISYDNTRTFHRFPKNERVKKIWMEAIGVSIITKNSMICSDHFEEKSYHQTDGYTYLRRLLNNAVPCVNLCNSNNKDLHNSYQTNDVSVFIKEENGPSDFQLQDREKNCNELDVSNENSTVFVIKTENTEFFEQPKLELDDNVNQIEICNIKTEHFEENYHTNNSVLISEENIKSENVESNIDTQEMSNEFEIKKELLHSDYELSDLKKEINDFDIEKFNNGSKNRLHSMEATFGNNAAKKSKCTGSEDDAKPKCYYYNSLLQGYVADSINHNDISTKDSAKITEEELSSVTSVENNLQQAQSSIPSLLYYSDIGKCIDPTDEKLVKEPESDKNFLLSCLPILNRLDVKKNQIARRKIQQLLFDIEFSNI